MEVIQLSQTMRTVTYRKHDFNAMKGGTVKLLTLFGPSMLAHIGELDLMKEMLLINVRVQDFNPKAKHIAAQASTMVVGEFKAD